MWYHVIAKCQLHAQGIVMKNLQTEHSLDAQAEIWAGALGDHVISEQTVDHWLNMAQRRWRWCKRSGMSDLAACYYAHARDELQRINAKRSQQNLAFIEL
jgi:hypothetical protein